MRKAIYFDCFSGISGNMVLGALLHLGGDADYLWRELNKLKLSGYQLRIGKGQKQGIDGVSVIVDVDEVKDGPGHTHNHDHSHSRDHSHDHDHSHGRRHHRSHRDIIGLIQNSEISEQAKSLALKIFQVIAQAEGKVHGIASGDVTFHEVGAVDSIIDIVGTAILLDYLKIDDVYCSPVKDGSGTIECAHGVIPVPVPAVMEMVGNSGITLLSDSEIKTELVTPTGFGILKGLNAKCGDIPQGQIEKIGYGFGTRETGRLNALRAALLTMGEEVHERRYYASQSEDHQEKRAAPAELPTGTAAKKAPVQGSVNDGMEDGSDKLEPELEESVIVMETNIDDMSSEVLGYTFDRLFEKGALDVFYTPIYMKKNRPAVKLSVICREKDKNLMAGVIFKETSSFGVRFYPVERIVLKRHFEQVHTPLGDVDVKVGQFGQWEKKAPEYESCAKLAEKTDLSIREIYDLVNRYS